MSTPPKAQDAGLLLLRLGVGGTLFAHGTQKLFGWFGGHGLRGTAGAMESMGFRPGRHSAVAAGLGEAGGGTLIMLGLATPLAGAAAAGTMATAGSVHVQNGFFNTNGGYELPFVLGLSAASLAVSGAGRFSLDQLTGRRLAHPALAIAGLAASLTSSALVVLKRRRAQQAEAEAAGQAHEQAQAQTETEPPPTADAARGNVTAGTGHA